MRSTGWPRFWRGCQSDHRDDVRGEDAWIEESYPGQRLVRWTGDEGVAVAGELGGTGGTEEVSGCRGAGSQGDSIVDLGHVYSGIRVGTI